MEDDRDSAFSALLGEHDAAVVLNLADDRRVAVFEDHDIRILAHEVQAVRELLAHRDARILVTGKIDRDGHKVASPGAIEAIVWRAAVRAARQKKTDRDRESNELFSFQLNPFF